MTSPRAAAPLSICLVSQEFPPHTNWGGVAVANGVLAGLLARHGHAVTVISRAAASAPAIETTADGVIVHRIDVAIGRKRLVGRTLDRMLFARAVARTVARLERGRPFDVIETIGASLEGDALVNEPAHLRRMVIQVHGSNAFGQVVEGPLAGLHRLDWAWSFRREQRTLALVPRVVIPSEATRAMLLDHGVGPEKIALVYHGIDTDRFHPPASPRRDSTLRVGFVGRLETRKGIDAVWRVVAAMADEPGVHFHLRGAIHPTIREETTALLDRHKSTVTYESPASHAEMPDYYRSLDVLFLPSRFENFGLAYAEAMATGLVVFAGTGGAGVETVTDGRTGFLVDPDGPVDDVVSLLRRMAADRGALAEVRAAARADVQRRFSLDVCAAARVALYREVAR